MTRYLIRRGIGALIVMWAVATLVFFIVRLVPGDPIAAMLFDTGDAAAVEQLRHKLGLDAPWEALACSQFRPPTIDRAQKLLF